jgi:hypothetical protein
MEEAERLGSAGEQRGGYRRAGEVPAGVTDEMTEELYSPSCSTRRVTLRISADVLLESARSGRTESWGDAVTVNGHSYADAERKTATPILPCWFHSFHRTFQRAD